MIEGKKVYALVESWDYLYSDYGEVFHRAHWLSRPTVEQVWGVVNNVHDSIWYTKEIVEKIVAGEYVDCDFEESSVNAFIAEYAILE